MILHKEIWIGYKMEHTLVNPNQLPYYRITEQDNPFANAPIFVSTEDC